MPARPPNFQAIALIVSGSFNLLAAAWIFADARARRADKPLFAALAVLLLGPLWLAFYMADRPLGADERRTGGFGWTWTRAFTPAWTASILPWIVPALLMPPVANGLGRLLLVWLVPVEIVTAIGAAIRRDDATTGSGRAPGRTRVPLAAVSVAATLVTFLILSALGLRVA